MTAPPACFRCPIGLPADRLAPLIGSWPGPALLESGPGFGAAGRWSILAAHPRLVFERDGRRSKAGPGFGPRALTALDDLLRRLHLAGPRTSTDTDRPPFQGGLIGYFGYDMAPWLERLPRRPRPAVMGSLAAHPPRMPDVRFALYDTFVAVDHATGAAELWAVDLLGEGAAATERRWEGWRTALDRPAPAPRPDSFRTPPESNFTREAYLAAVRRALEYIAAGDIFQVNLSQRFAARLGEVEGLDLYLRLKARSPAPFAAFLGWGDSAIVGASPESFYQVRGDHIITRPIKGTRPRGGSPGEDARLIGELTASAKDRAELTMIVDLERNDLGRVCRYGSVRVTEPLAVESFAQVHHLVATVEGRLRPGVGPIDVVRAVFPGGSITGAPKIRAMEIIDELEPTLRGPYTGAVGYFSRGGTSAFNIAIRTMLVERDVVSYQVGGGIVADSEPEAEYEETLHKGRGVREVIEGWGAGG